jgi:predicted CxxxxCH...CXXCH cytochrome family protein
MNRLSMILLTISVALLLGACSDDSSSAPEPGEVHPQGWIVDHADKARDDVEGCKTCHGLDLSGSGEAVSCFSCHTAGSPLVLTNCASCHGTPPNGTARPNRDEAHTPHKALPDFPGQDDCSACHQGAGAGTERHFDSTEPADVIVRSDYNAKTGAASYDVEAMSCSGVSCHGGQQTPSWFEGALDVREDCRSCHELGTAPLTPQLNSYYSGQHAFHAGTLGLGCTICHSPLVLGRTGEPNHFSGLETPEFELEPALTIQPDIGYNAVEMTCTTNLAACHGSETRLWQ